MSLMSVSFRVQTLTLPSALDVQTQPCMGNICVMLFTCRFEDCTEEDSSYALVCYHVMRNRKIYRQVHVIHTQGKRVRTNTRDQRSEIRDQRSKRGRERERERSDREREI